MKRTTYIMIGMLVTGVAMVCGLMFYVVDRNVTQKDNFMEIGGERKTVQLPSCRVLKLTQPPVVWKQVLWRQSVCSRSGKCRWR